MLTPTSLLLHPISNKKSPANGFLKSLLA